MDEVELRQVILDYIKNCYKAEYIGLLQVKKLNPGYVFIIGIPSYMFPTTITCDYDNDESFLNFIYAEIRTRNYMRADMYKVIRTNDSKEKE